MRRWQPYKKTLEKVLKDPRMAVGYLNTALEEGEWDAFLLALRNVAEVHGGMSKLAREVNLNRENLYRMLSTRGNPGMRNIFNILNAMGFRLTLLKDEPLDKAA